MARNILNSLPFILLQTALYEPTNRDNDAVSNNILPLKSLQMIAEKLIYLSRNHKGVGYPTYQEGNHEPQA